MPFSSRISARKGGSSEADDKSCVIPVHSVDTTTDNTSDVSFFELADPKPEVSSGANTLTAHNINYHVKLPKRFWQKENQILQILSNVTGVFAPGLNAILGNYGAGKTSFLNVLAGRVGGDQVGGAVLLNGHPIPENFKSLVGFVAHNDSLQGYLTVKENISFSASLRLPSCLTNSERNERIDAVIRELELSNYADVKVGTTYIKGITPGARKLCSIGMELVISPPVLFLDEPTTALDPITSNSIIFHLKRLSSQGRTIVFSVTQPRCSAYERFDNILLLSSGCTIFHGSTKDVLEFFLKQGFKCPKRNNPADFFMEVINADQSSIAGYSRMAKKSSQHGPADSVAKDASTVYYDRTSVQQALIKGFACSQWCADLLLNASEVYAQYERRKRLSVMSMNRKTSTSTQTFQRVEQYSSSILNQFLVVSVRAIRNLIRNPEMGIKTAFTTLFFSVIMAGIYWQLEQDPATGFSDRAGVLFFLVLIQLFYNISSLEKLFVDRLTFLQEHKSGCYRVSVHLFIKTFLDILPLRLLAAGLMSTIVYFSVGLRDNAGSFFLFILCLVLVSMTSAGISLLVSATFRTFAMGQMTISLVYMLMLLFSGYMINLGSLGVWISWMRYLSMIRYSLAALYINEFQDRIFCNADNSTCQTGNAYLTQNNMDFGNAWNLWQNYLALFILSLALFGLSYVQLRRLAASS